MRARVLVPLLSVSVVALAACAGRASGPPPLAYGLPDPAAASYTVGDTVIIGIQALGQSLSLEAKSVARYALAFERAGDALRATLDVEDLEAEITAPMAGPMRVDETMIDGRLVVSLDRLGNFTVVEGPEIEDAAAPYYSGPTIASSLFPGLPGRVVGTGDSWVDTVAHSETGETGESSQRSVLNYTVVGDVTADGRPLLEIVFEGTSELSQTMSIEGIAIQQSTSLEVEGRLLWDAERGLVSESETRSEGAGTVQLAVMPAPLPTRVQMRQRVRLGAP